MKRCHNPLWFCQYWRHVVPWILVIIGLDSCLSPLRCQTTTWSNAEIVSNEYLGSNFNEIWIRIQDVSVCILFYFDIIFITAPGVPETIRFHNLSPQTRKATNLVVTSRDLGINAGKTTAMTTMHHGTVHHLPKLQACLNVSPGVHFTINCSVIIQIRWKLVLV